MNTDTITERHRGRTLTTSEFECSLTQREIATAAGVSAGTLRALTEDILDLVE